MSVSAGIPGSDRIGPDRVGTPVCLGKFSIYECVKLTHRSQPKRCSRVVYIDIKRLNILTYIKIVYSYRVDSYKLV